MNPQPAERWKNRSAFSKLFGTFFSDQHNTSGLLALVLVGGVVGLSSLGKPVPDRLWDAALVVVGFYFGGVGNATISPVRHHYLTSAAELVSK
jgi:hypothetical protein